MHLKSLFVSRAARFGQTPLAHVLDLLLESKGLGLGPASRRWV